MQINIGSSPQAAPVRGAGSAAPSRYEAAFARLIAPDARAFAFWKGRVALYAILKALGIGPGDEVILPAFTCVVVPNAIRFTGAKPVYADIAPGGYNIDPQCVAGAVTPRTRAVLVQHTFGIPGPAAACRQIAEPAGAALIEDCAHALGSTHAGHPLGSEGDAAFFSSQWSKPYTTGLGGVAVTRDPNRAGRIARVAEGFRQPPAAASARLSLQYSIYQQYFSPRLYWQAQGILQNFSRFGLFVGSSSQDELEGEMPPDHTWRMPPGAQAAGLEQMAGFGEVLARRRALAELYDSAMQQAGWEIAPRPSGTSLLRYPVRVANKVNLLEKARRARVELGSWFETPLHPTPLAGHAKFGFMLGRYPNAERMAAQVVNLPMHRWMTESEAQRTLDFFFANAVPAE